MITVETESELVETVRHLDGSDEPVLVLGGGSNVLVDDAGFDGTVVKVATRGIAEDTAACSGAVIAVAAGEPWDQLVSHAIERGWSGTEAMSGIPGLVGATPIQNVGAYGADVSELISMVRTLDRSTGKLKTFVPVECGFGYRTSRFKSDPGRRLVGDFSTSDRLDVPTDPLCRTGSVAGRCSGAACSSCGGTRSRVGAAQHQGHGARGR
jgi:UDP-N-acetylmuramate dehydrogenase